MRELEGGERSGVRRSLNAPPSFYLHPSRELLKFSENLFILESTDFKKNINFGDLNVPYSHIFLPASFSCSIQSFQSFKVSLSIEMKQI